MLQEQVIPTRDELLDALHAVRETIDIPHAATVGEQEKRDAILIDRVGHAVAMLRGLLGEDSWHDWSWSTATSSAAVQGLDDSRARRHGWSASTCNDRSWRSS
jgi:hypothetical protein